MTTTSLLVRISMVMLRNTNYVYIYFTLKDIRCSCWEVVYQERHVLPYIMKIPY